MSNEEKKQFWMKLHERMNKGGRLSRKTSEKLKEIVLAISLICGFGAMGHTIFWLAENGDSSADRTRREELNRRHETDPSWEYIDEPDTEMSKEDWNNYLKGLAFILAPALLMTCIYIGHKALIARQEKRENQAAHRRKRALSEIGAELELDEQQMQKLITFVPGMIEEMPDEQAVWFEMLLEGNVEIANNPEFKKMATTVLQNYLESHPQVIEQLAAKISMNNTHSEIQGYNPLNNSNGIGR